jgi:deoxycytidine triphosphate deaminase
MKIAFFEVEEWEKSHLQGHFEGEDITLIPDILNEQHMPQWGDAMTMPADGIELQPGQFILCCTMETVAIPNDACAALFSKSSTGRIGLEHLHAGWIDPGFVGQLTLEFKNVAPWPILLQPGKRYMQMVVYDLTAPAERDYSMTGRYQGQTGATPAREAR